MGVDRQTDNLFDNNRNANNVNFAAIQSKDAHADLLVHCIDVIDYTLLINYIQYEVGNCFFYIKNDLESE